MLIFIAIAIGAFLLVAGSFLFGHDHDVGHDHDLGHDMGADAEPTISFFSVKTMATLLMGFGSAGAIAMQYGANHLVASLVGLGCGLVLAALMYLVLSLFYQQQASSLIATSDAMGCSGTVTASIVENGLGEVSLSVDGQYTTYSASSRDGLEISKGQTVRVVRTMGSQLVVERENPI
jgi:membrane protein implicated in regulation of membrane protease activity